MDLEIGKGHCIVNPAHYLDAPAKSIYSVGAEFGDARVRVATFSAKANAWNWSQEYDVARAGWPVCVLVADQDILKVSILRLSAPANPQVTDPNAVDPAVVGLTVVTRL